MDNLNQTRIYVTRSEHVKKLAGFEKHHDIPSTISHFTLDWLEKITHAELDEKLSDVFQSLRSAYGFKRRELKVQGPLDRSGYIETPFFTFQASVGLDEESPSHAVWTDEINNIVDADHLMCEEFSTCFESTGWNLEVKFEDPIDLEEIVDRIEDEEQDGFQVDFDKDLTWCEIRIPETTALLRATSNTFDVSIKGASSPQDLLIALAKFEHHLLDQMRRIEP